LLLSHTEGTEYTEELRRALPPSSVPSVSSV